MFVLCREINCRALFAAWLTALWLRGQRFQAPHVSGGLRDANWRTETAHFGLETLRHM
jgi:hypothetical protein